MPRAVRLSRMPQAWRRAEGSKPGGRLIEEDQVGVADQPEGKLQTTLLTTGEGLDPCVGLLLEADHGDHLVDEETTRVHGTVDGQRLPDAELSLDRPLLEDYADPFPIRTPPGRRVEAEYRDLASVGGPMTLEDLDGRRLPGAVGTEQGENLAGFDSQVHAVYCGHIAVVLDQALHLDGRHWSDAKPS